MCEQFHPDPARKLSAKPVWHIPLLCVQRRTPDGGQRNCPKHAEFYSKNKFEKLVYLFGFIIRIYHDARSSKRQTFCNTRFVSLKFYGTLDVAFISSTCSTLSFSWLDECGKLLWVMNAEGVWPQMLSIVRRFLEQKFPTANTLRLYTTIEQRTSLLFLLYTFLIQYQNYWWKLSPHAAVCFIISSFVLWVNALLVFCYVTFLWPYSQHVHIIKWAMKPHILLGQVFNKTNTGVISECKTCVWWGWGFYHTTVLSQKI